MLVKKFFYNEIIPPLFEFAFYYIDGESVLTAKT